MVPNSLFRIVFYCIYIRRIHPACSYCMAVKLLNQVGTIICIVCGEMNLEISQRYPWWGFFHPIPKISLLLDATDAVIVVLCCFFLNTQEECPISSLEEEVLGSNGKAHRWQIWLPCYCNLEDLCCVWGEQGTILYPQSNSPHEANSGYVMLRGIRLLPTIYLFFAVLVHLFFTNCPPLMISKDRKNIF